MSRKQEIILTDKPSILVVLEPHHEVTRLLRLAKRKSKHENVPWKVLYVETPQSKREFNSRERQNLLNSLTLAEQMGAVILKRTADSVFEGVVDCINEKKENGNKIHSIFVAIDKGKKYYFPFKRPLAKKIIRKYEGKLKIVVVPLGVEVPIHKRYANLLKVNLKEIFISLLAVLVATAFIELLDYVAPAVELHSRNRSIIYMIACAFAAARYGLLAGIITSVASFLALNLLYIAPYYKVIIDNSTNAINLGLFILAGIALSVLNSKDYGNRLALAKRAERFDSLLKVHRIALSNSEYIEVVGALDKELGELLGTDITFFFPSMKDKSELHTLLTGDMNLSEANEKALYVCWEEGKVTGVGAPYCPKGCDWRFEPLLTAQNELGVMGICVNGSIEVDVDFGRLLSGIADQVALILERLGLEELAEDTRVKAEKEKLRAMLLSSVSHDLKTPLASIIGSLSVYRSMGEMLPAEHRTTLIETAIEEAQRLDSFITNILDMTRIESGQIELKEEWVNPHHLIQDGLKRLKERLRYNIVSYEPPKEGFEVAMDYMMMGQVLQNLLDNAVKYTKLGSKIEISWVAKKTGFTLSVRDNGSGIPEDKLEDVFDKYERIKKQDSQIAGTGLGLAIAKAVLQAQGGDIVAKNHAGGGAVFIVTLPKARKIKRREVA